MKNAKPLLLALLLGTILPGMVACSPSPTRPSAGEYIDDATITTRVKVAFAEDPTVKMGQVNVETYRGVVQLSGFVDSSAAVQRAAEIARGIPGVKSVKNDIRVRSQVR